MPKITNKQKLEAIKEWLKENGIDYKENVVKKKTGLQIDLWVQKLLIAFHIDDENSQEFYKNTFKWCKPFFIRESETKEFIIEKLQNCCFEQMVRLQKKFEKNQENKKS